jgi:protein-glutamine gamma-glutamyltransferase
MIKVNQQIVKISDLNNSSLTKEKADILKQMDAYREVYEYATFDQLDFDVSVKLQIIESSVLLRKSGAKFATFARSRCNEKYWKRTDNGGFQLLPTVSPHQAIDDIFYNGHEYAFECATAVIIIFYKAVLNNIGKANFNRLFADLYLHDWQYDEDLELHGYKGSDYLPGDCAYFKNPDYNPDTPQWKGENTIVLDETLYFGHGIGITTRERIIEVLNLKRKDNAKQSAYLSDEIVRLHTAHVSYFAVRYEPVVWYDRNSAIISTIGSITYVA